MFEHQQPSSTAVGTNKSRAPFFAKTCNRNHVPFVRSVASTFFAQRRAKNTALCVLAARSARSGNHSRNEATDRPLLSVKGPLHVQISLPLDAPRVGFSHVFAQLHAQSFAGSYKAYAIKIAHESGQVIQNIDRDCFKHITCFF